MTAMRVLPPILGVLVAMPVPTLGETAADPPQEVRLPYEAVRLDTGAGVPGSLATIRITPALRSAPLLPSGTATTCAAKEEVPLADTSAYESVPFYDQSVAALAGGLFGVVWWQGRVSPRDLRMQWLGPDGRPIFPPGGVVVAGSAADEFLAVIVAHPTAGAYVAFLRGNENVVVQYFDGDGQPQWPGDGVPATAGAFSRVTDPHLVANPTGGAFVCFRFLDDLLGVQDVRCQHIDAGGVPRWGTNGSSVGNGGSNEGRVLPRGLSDGAGGLMLFWRNQRSLSAPAGPPLMEGQRFGPDGQKLWGATPKVVRTTQLGPQNGYSFDFFNVVSDGQGGAVLAFNDWLDHSESALDVVAQRVSVNGDLLWGEGAIVTAAPGHQQHDQTIAAGDGGAIVAVYESVSSSSNRLFLYRLGADGTHTWPSTGISLPDPDAPALDYSVFGSFDGGTLRVAWTHQELPETFEFDVQVATLNSQGVRTGATFLTEAPDAQFSRGLAYSAEFGGVLGVWDDRRKGTWADLDVTAGFLKEAIACPIGDFHTVTPCRLVDTRGAGGSPLTSRQSRTYGAVGACGIPPGASAIAVNVTAVSPAAQGYLTLYPAGGLRPLVSTINFGAGQTRGNNAILGLSFTGAFTVYPQVGAAGNVHFIVDVTGYFN